jgi:very-short-patch-repair endonuclease
VDFFCREERLVIEIDGPIHKGQSTADQERQQLLEAAGLRVIRVSSTDVETDVIAVLKRIRQEFGPQRRPLSRARERGDR